MNYKVTRNTKQWSFAASADFFFLFFLWEKGRKAQRKEIVQTVLCVKSFTNPKDSTFEGTHCKRALKKATEKKKWWHEVRGALPRVSMWHRDFPHDSSFVSFIKHWSRNNKQRKYKRLLEILLAAETIRRRRCFCYFTLQVRRLFVVVVVSAVQTTDSIIK